MYDTSSRRASRFAVPALFQNGFTVFGCKNGGFTVPSFLSGLWLSAFYNVKLLQKLKLKLLTIVQYYPNNGEVPPIFVFTNVFEALELVFSFVW